MKCKWCDKEAIPGEKFCPSCKEIIQKNKNLNGITIMNTTNLKSNSPDDETVSSSNAIATILKVIGIIILVIGVISSFSFYDEVVGISILIIAIILSCSFFGFGEIIRLLQKISNKLN